MFKRNSKMNYSPQDPHLPELTRPFPAPRLFHGKLRHSALLAGCFGEGGHFSMGNHWQIHMPLLFLIILYFPGTLWWRVFWFLFFVWQNGKGGLDSPRMKVRIEGLFSSLNVLLKGETLSLLIVPIIIAEYVTLKLYPRLRPCLF